MPQAAQTPDNMIGVPHSSGLLETKLYARTARANLVARPRIVKLLDDGLSSSLILVSAPAGFGKTTILTEWLSAKDEGRRQKGEKKPGQESLHPYSYAWLSLDAADNDPNRFWAYVILAMQSIRDELGEMALAQLRSPQPPPVQQVLPGLLNEMDAFQDRGILVLDDYHVITSTAVHGTLTHLLENLPPDFHVVVSTRSDPPIPLAKLRARRQVTEIRTDDLRFTPGEAAAFLNEIMDLALSSEQVATLDDRTEGWIAGLQMAALSMRGRDAERVDSFIRAFAGTHRFIMDYLVEEVLAREPEEVQSFLLRTAILTRLAGPLCEAVTGTGAGQEMLERLERSNLFVVPLDDNRTWYRYHHLFADLLRTQLGKSLGAQDIAQLHVRAAEWHALCGSVHEAINHASLASDDERVERFIEQNYREMVSRGEQAGMRFWTGKLSRELVYRRPWLCIYEAYSHSWFGELDDAELLLDKAEERMRSMDPAPDMVTMQAQLAYVKSRVTAMRGDLARAIALCLQVREHIAPDNLALQFDSRVTLGYEYFLSGDYASADRTLNEMIRLGVPAGAAINTVAAACIVARSAAIQGHLRKSYEVYQNAAQWISQAGGQHPDASALVEVGIADVLCERNELGTALEHLQQGLTLLPYWGKADDLVLAYMTLARIQLAQGNQTEAAHSVQQAVQLIQSCGVFTEARSAAESGKVRSWLVQRDWPSVDGWIAALEQRFGSHDPFRFEDELIQITLARAYIARNRLDAAIHLLSSLEKCVRSRGRQGRLIEILMLQALAAEAAADTRQANTVLMTSLELAEPEGYVRIFLDEGRPMQALLTRWVAKVAAGPLREYAIRLLSQFDREREAIPPAHGQAALAGSLVEPLTPRELEVLQLICEGNSNQAIADKLVITLSAVKKHTGNILGKLGVTSRAQAMVKARELDLFPDER